MVSLLAMNRSGKRTDQRNLVTTKRGEVCLQQPKTGLQAKKDLLQTPVAAVVAAVQPKKVLHLPISYPTHPAGAWLYKPRRPFHIY